MSASARRLAVWGDPIGHSRSPQMHRAAYRQLGLDWTYQRRRVDVAAFPDALRGLDTTWRGLSLTMPLKEIAFRTAQVTDPAALSTGAVNTFLLGEEGPQGFNTDVGGIVDALSYHGMGAVERVRVLGAGATAASAVVAASMLGASHVDVRARRPEAARALGELVRRQGMTASTSSFAAPTEPVDLTVATLPSGTVLADEDALVIAAAGGALFEAAYAPWPSALAAIWPDPRVISGYDMLVHQAVRQIRIFLAGDAEQPLAEEQTVLAVMRSAGMGD